MSYVWLLTVRSVVAANNQTDHFVRLSFGPPMEVLERGLDGIERLLKRAEAAIKRDGHLHQEMGRNYKRKPDHDVPERHKNEVHVP